MAFSPVSPRVSVCIASYNHARFLPAALDSVLGQTFADLELIVADDGSSDDSLEILRRYAERDPRVTVLTHPGGANRGISATTNLALRAASGELVAWLGSDDAYYSDTVARQVAALDLTPGAGFVYGTARVIDETGRERPELIGADINWDARPFERLLEANQIPALTVMVRRSCLDHVGFYDDEVNYGDWELMLRVLAHYGAVFLPEPLAQYRIHGKNFSLAIEPELNQRQKQQALEALRTKCAAVGGRLSELAIQKLIERRIRELPKQTAQAYWDRFYTAAGQGDLGVARAAARQAAGHDPAELVRPRRLASVIKHTIKGLFANGANAGRNDAGQRRDGSKQGSSTD